MSEQWFKASRSYGNGACVEVRREWDNGVPMVAVRDSKNPTGAVLLYTVAEWDAFLHGVRAGEFDGDRALTAPDCAEPRHDW